MTEAEIDTLLKQYFNCPSPTLKDVQHLLERANQTPAYFRAATNQMPDYFRAAANQMPAYFPASHMSSPPTNRKLALIQAEGSCCHI